MFSLTVREQVLIAAVLLAFVSGTIIHHLRTRDTSRVLNGIGIVAKDISIEKD